MGILDMSASENTDQLPRERTLASHTLLLSGLFLGGVRCMARIRMASVAGQPGVTMEFNVRSDRADVSQLIVESIG
jgi:coatomer protein complex subunit gamma